jgi:mono/diheme cytochrome c family protein
LTDPTVWRSTTPSRWFDIISNGVEGEAMPPFGEASSNPLSQTDRWNLVAYLYTLGTPPAQVAMGQALYERNCADCHGANGGGSETSPGFVDLEAKANRSQADLFSAIADSTVGGHDLGLGDVEIWALTDYVRTFSYDYAAPSTTDASIVASPFAGGEGVVSGKVINGTAGAAPPEGLVIQLRAFDMNAAFVDAITTTVAADGSFRLEGIDTTAPVQLEPLTVYQDVSYFGDLETAITLSPEQPEANVNVIVYDTTDDPRDIRIERLHVVFDFSPGRAQVAELYILSNDGDRAYVGTLEEGTVRLTVPADALSFQPGGDPSRFLTLADGIADTIPIVPGSRTAQSILVYDLAYDDSVELSRPMPFDANVISIFLPDEAGIEVSGGEIRPGGPFQAQETVLETYLVDSLSAGDRLTLRLSGELRVTSEVSIPSPHGTSEFSQTQSIVIGVVVLIGATAVSFLYWQGRVRFRLQPGPQDHQVTLLQAIADLDDDFEAGRLKKQSYRRRRAQIKEELIELMESQH